MTETATAAPDRRAQILDAAEALAREGGYGAFSFRDLAEAVGIRSASVHYHFPTKRALAAVLVARYTDRFLDALGPPEAPEAPARLVAAFRRALAEEDRMCLCGALGAQSATLPEEVAAGVRGFFDRLLGWAAVALGNPARAEAAVATLEGALILARVTGDLGAFDRAAGRIAQDSRSASA